MRPPGPLPRTGQALAPDWPQLLGELAGKARDERLARFDAWPAVQAELARWLALWMAFDDIVHVAALKLAAGRQARVRREVKAGDHELVGADG